MSADPMVSSPAPSALLMRSLDAGVLRLTLNRPERLNALNWQLMRELCEALNEAAVDPGVRVVVLAGSGRAFCSGGDVRGREQLDPGDPLSDRWGGTAAWRSQEVRASQLLRLAASSKLLHTLPKPTIAMVRGAAVGAGLCLAAACDLRIASNTAVFNTAFGSVARSGDFGGSYLLPRLVGTAKARELYFFADKVDAPEALRIGLVNRVVPDDQLEALTLEWAHRLAKGPGAAYRYMKRNLNAAETMTFEQVLEIEAHNMMRCAQTDDARELVSALKESREPKFQGF